MTNTARGDIAIKLDGQDYIIRPTFQCLCDIESATGTPVLALAERLADGNISLTDIASIVEAGIKAGSYVGLSREVIGREIMRVGIAAFLAVVSEFFSIALTGEVDGDDTKKKPGLS